MKHVYRPEGLGWHRDLPDHRDFTPEYDEIAEAIRALETRDVLPDRVDWREYCAAVENQGALHSSTAHACLGLVQYFEQRANGHLLELSPRFLYKATRGSVNRPGNCGTQLRTTLRTISTLGVPAEQRWPFDVAQFDDEPDALTVASARRFASLRYVRLDGLLKSGTAILESVKRFLAGGFACVLGFPVTTSLTAEADIPYPTVYDGVRGGQAVLVIGYDDHRRYRSDQGSLLVRNSWGRQWGDQGYGWLPYRYLRQRLAADVWTVVKDDWLGSGEFLRPT